MITSITLKRGIDTSPWTVPDDPYGPYELRIECFGPGGGGGGSQSATEGGAGGGGGAHAVLTVQVYSGDNVNFVIGAGGVSGIAQGSPGGNTWAVVNGPGGCVAPGGRGGGGAPGAEGIPALGGSGGPVASGYGDVVQVGGYGENGGSATGTGRGGYGGSSAALGYVGHLAATASQAWTTVTYPTGSNPLGAGYGGNGGLNNAVGNTPVPLQYGGGGGGAGGAPLFSEGIFLSGGAGADGKIVITYGFDDPNALVEEGAEGTASGLDETQTVIFKSIALRSEVLGNIGDLVAATGGGIPVVREAITSLAPTRLPMRRLEGFPRSAGATQYNDTVTENLGTALDSCDVTYGARELTSLAGHRLPVRFYVAFPHALGPQSDDIAEVLYIDDNAQVNARFYAAVAETDSLISSHDGAKPRTTASVSSIGAMGMPHERYDDFQHVGDFDDSVSEGVSVVDAASVLKIWNTSAAMGDTLVDTTNAPLLTKTGAVVDLSVGLSDLQSTQTQFAAIRAEVLTATDLHDASRAPQIADFRIEQASAVDVVSVASGTASVSVVEVAAAVAAQDMQVDEQIAENVIPLDDTSAFLGFLGDLIESAVAVDEPDTEHGQVVIVAEVSNLHDTPQTGIGFGVARAEVASLRGYHELESEPYGVQEEFADLVDTCFADVLALEDMSEERTHLIAASNREVRVPLKGRKA